MNRACGSDWVWCCGRARATAARRSLSRISGLAHVRPEYTDGFHFSLWMQQDGVDCAMLVSSICHASSEAKVRTMARVGQSSIDMLNKLEALNNADGLLMSTSRT